MAKWDPERHGDVWDALANDVENNDIDGVYGELHNFEEFNFNHEDIIALFEHIDGNSGDNLFDLVVPGNEGKEIRDLLKAEYAKAAKAAINANSGKPSNGGSRKRRNTKRRDNKRRNTKRRGTKRRNTKRRDNKRRNTKRRGTKRH